MGNKICSCSMIQHHESQDIQLLQTLKAKIFTLYQESNFECKKISEFFHSELAEAVSKYEVTGRQKELPQKPIATHYDTVLNNVLSIEDTDYQKKYSSDDIARQAFVLIREQLITNDKNIFILIISKYFQFLENYMISHKPSHIIFKKKSNQLITKQNNLPNTQLSPEILNKIINTLSKQQLSSLVSSLVKIFSSLRLIIIYQYQDILSIFFTNNVEAKPQFEVSIQRVIQQFLFTKDGILKPMLKPLLLRYYSQEQTKVQDDWNEEVKYLDKKLMPISSFRLWDQPDAKSISIYEQARKYSSPQMSPKLRIKNSLIQEEYSEIKQIITEDNDIPYEETFQLIIEIIEEFKLWRKYILIESFNQMIIDLYLFKRSEGQLQDYLEIINAEDNKSEIQSFILQRFFERHTQYDVYKDLYVQIKFMYDFDEILDEKIKFMFSPAFLRFYTLLDMMVNKKNQ